MEKTLCEKQTLSEDAATYSKQLLSLCQSDCTAGKTTLFLGDSFFDTRMFCEGFYDFFAGKDVIAAGIAGATTYDWRQLAPKLFVKSPKNLVVNLGTNNFYDDYDSTEQAIENLQALFMQFHELFPQTEIYYFSIVHRGDPCYSREIDSANAALKNWSEGKPWMHFIDIVSKVPASALRDGVHPKPESYQIYWNALLASGIEIEEKRREEKNHFGVMLDCSRNAVMSVDALKRFLCDLERMDYNTLLLYTEDTYELPAYPLFGKFRGRYSQEELKEIDAYAREHGIELIPCIQTLAHLDKLFAWPGFEKYRDCFDILLAGDERVYKLIDSMFAACEACFSSKRVHIGMDEAHFLGLGNYALQHGAEDRLAIFGNHLKRVTELAKKHGLQPMIWSDMAFRLSGGSYEAVTGRESELEKLLPAGLELVYWDYYRDSQEEYEVQIRKHEQLHRPLWFAGGAWKWTGFASGNRISIKRTEMAFQACKNHGIENIFLTLWGDNGNECPAYAVLPTLFYASELRKGNGNIEAIKEKFKRVFGEEWDDFLLFDLASPATNKAGKKWGFEAGKVMLYNDCFLGRFDSFVFGTGEERKEYLQYAEKFDKAVRRSQRFKAYFESYGALCRLLAEKYDLGFRTRKAYAAHDKKTLVQLVKDYVKTAELVGDFLKAFRKMWYADNKPQGFEVQEIRLGGLKQRLESCRERLAGYLAGDVEKIDELKESAPDYFDGVAEEERNYSINHYVWTATVNGL